MDMSASHGAVRKIPHKSGVRPLCPTQTGTLNLRSAEDFDQYPRQGYAQLTETREKVTNAENALQKAVQLALADPSFACLVEAWPDVPAKIRAAVLAMVSRATDREIATFAPG